MTLNNYLIAVIILWIIFLSTPEAKNVMYKCAESAFQFQYSGYRCTIKDFRFIPNETYSFGAINPDLITELKFQNSKFRWLPRDPLKLYDKIQILDIESTGVMNLAPGDLGESRNLTKLIAPLNRLVQLDVNTFDGAESLKWINFSYNELNFVHMKAFSNLLGLEVLDLNHNQLRYLNKNVFFQLKKLKTIFLSDNKLMYLDKFIFYSPTHLESVVLNKNSLEQINLQLRNNHITYFYATRNRIKKFHLDVDSKEYQDHNFYVELSRNMMNSFYINPIFTVTSLALAYNHFTGLGNITQLTKLTYLDISYNNQIGTTELWALQSLAQLRELHLNGLGMAEIDKRFFLSNRNFKNLDVITFNMQETRLNEVVAERSDIQNTQWNLGNISLETIPKVLKVPYAVEINELADDILPTAPGNGATATEDGAALEGGNVTHLQTKLDDLLNQLHVLENNTNLMNMTHYQRIGDTELHLRVVHLVLIFFFVAIVLLFIFILYIYAGVKTII